MEIDNVNSEKFGYPFKTKIAYLGLTTLLIVPAFIIGLLALPISILTGKFFQDLVGFTIFLGSCIVIYMTIGPYLTMVNGYGDIICTKNGLRIQIFAGIFYWKEVPWEDMLWIKHFPSKYEESWIVGTKWYSR